jgi:hypothetical protein
MGRNEFDFPKEHGLSTYSAIYVPSTKGVNKKISEGAFSKRITETQRFMTKEFGGTTTDREVGTYTAKSGSVVKERVAKVENYSSFTDWKKKDTKVRKFVKDKAKEWGQESISFEFEAPHRPKKLVFIEPTARRKMEKVI